MKEPIVEKAVYTTSEVAKILGLNESTIQKHVRDGKLAAKKLGGMYRITGQSIMDFMGMGPEPTPIRQQLIEKIEETAEYLQPKLKKFHSNSSVYLSSSISKHADDSTLRRILSDLQEELERRSKK